MNKVRNAERDAKDDAQNSHPVEKANQSKSKKFIYTPVCSGLDALVEPL